MVSIRMTKRLLLVSEYQWQWQQRMIGRWTTGRQIVNAINGRLDWEYGVGRRGERVDGR